jgi:SAM-dependent methyltransferase
MKEDQIKIEESRLTGLEDVKDYKWIKERHRIFPAVFENRQHQRILDLSAGVGILASRIKNQYPSYIICNDISPTCLKILRKNGLQTLSFDLDNPHSAYPFPEGYFDAVISMVTIEHLYNVDHVIREINRILCPGGYLYISTPNYAAPEYLKRFVLHGETFHDPLAEETRYEFYAHIRYFTYKTLLKFVSSFGFIPDTVYCALPSGSSAYKALYASSKVKALAYRYARYIMFKAFPTSWAPEPVLCFRKIDSTNTHKKIRKVIL